MFIAPVTFKLPVTSVLMVCLIVVPSSVVAEFPTVDADVNLTNVLFVPDTVIDVPELPEEPFVPFEPEVPDVAAVYDVPFIDNEPVMFKLPVTWCVSSNVSPNFVDPEEYITDDVTYVMKSSSAVIAPLTLKEPVISTFLVADHIEPVWANIESPDEPFVPLEPDEPFVPLEPDVPLVPLEPLVPFVR